MSTDRWKRGPTHKLARDLLRHAICYGVRLKACLAAQFAQQPVACLVALCIALVVATALIHATAIGPRTKHVRSIDGLRDYYRELGYVEHAVRSGASGVPRVYLADIPEQWAGDQPIAIKKSIFFLTMLPLVLRANEDIEKDRRRLQRIAAAAKANGAIIGEQDRNWLRRLALRYEVVDPSAPRAPARQLIAPLLLRVNTIPPSLALAQAAIESGYGSSRFAVQGNALFGQWRTDGGLRPADQPEHLSEFGVATFSSPLRSVAAYAHNLNTFPAYLDFRAARAKLPSATAQRSLMLADTLAAYSERGGEYVAMLKRIIRDNDLARFDAARLRDGRAVIIRLPQRAPRRRPS